MSANVQMLADNVAFIPEELLGNQIAGEIDGVQYHSFRIATLGATKGAVCLSRKPHELTTNDIQAINRVCDRHEGSLNKLVKADIAGALSYEFNNRAFDLYEIGCGENPIMAYIPSNRDVRYTGIECDERALHSLKKRGFAAMNWDQAMQNEPASKRPMVATAVYALHMIVSSKLAKRLSKFTNKDGFFVGNFYIDPREARNPEGRERLAQILENAGLEFKRIKDTPSNEYWVIHKPEAAKAAESFTKKLECMMYRNRRASSIPAVRQR